MRWFTVLILAACLAYAACEPLVCAEEKSSDPYTDCVECKTDDLCADALGDDWICSGGCCEVDNDDGDGYDPPDDYDDDDGYGCDDNVAPELLGYEIWGDIDGDGNYDRKIEATPLEFAVGAYASYFIGYSYNDDDCNLPGGEFWSRLTVNDGVEQDPHWEADSNPLPEELGCSTEQSGLIYGFLFTPAVGAYELNVYWTDICDAQSNQIDVLWTITP